MQNGSKIIGIGTPYQNTGAKPVEPSGVDKLLL